MCTSSSFRTTLRLTDPEFRIYPIQPPSLPSRFLHFPPAGSCLCLMASGRWAFSVFQSLNGPFIPSIVYSRTLAFRLSGGLLASFQSFYLSYLLYLFCQLCHFCLLCLHR
ncbi:hypothetical protein C8Q74DRAFT_1250868 [Fomes fomentarius]|nr:hypothetical protein C8Q74DRAFT_1250868 [Fomes fomentarius]